MFKNYLKVAFRNIFKNKFYSFLNILGLSIGITAAVLIIIYIQDELNFDNFHPQVEEKYVIGLEGKIGNQEIEGFFTPPILGATIAEETPGVIQTTRTNNLGELVVRHEAQSYTERNVIFADSNFFDFFGYELLEGDPETVLKGPNKTVITPSIASKYFGSRNPIGMTFEVGTQRTLYEVTGLIAEPKNNSHLNFNVVLSYSTNPFSRNETWLSNSINTYMQIHPESNPEVVEAALDELVIKYAGAEIEQFMGVTIEQMREAGNKYGYFATPLLDLHLNAADIDNSFEPAGDITYIYIFSIIGVFLIIIACVNFMNLSTASAAGRAKEVGLRKTLGGERGEMIRQFLFESISYVIIAAIISIGLMYLALPWFNTLSGKFLSLEILFEPWFIGIFISLIILVGLIAGSYPALYLTAFHPVDVLKGSVVRAAKGGRFRQVLVGAQFFISIGLIACTILVNQQLQYMQNRNLGINKEQSIVLTNLARLDGNQEAFKEALNSDTKVISASYSNFTVPGTNNITLFQRPNRDTDYIMAVYFADYQHQEALEFEMVEGRYFSEDFPTDSTALVINQSAVSELGFEESPIGEEIIFPGAASSPDELPVYTVIGVMKDFNFQSLRENIMPLAIGLTETANEMIVRFRSEDPRDAVDFIETTWGEFAANDPIDYTFLDDDFDALFRQEQRLGNVFTAFTVIAIIIACLGLLGLSAYMAEQRTKEIGVRKVLGASIPSILGLLSLEFLKLIAISFVLAIPVSWYFVNGWLQNFAYRTDINPLVFLGTALVTLLIVLLTISWQTIKAASMNPVRSLKSE